MTAIHSLTNPTKTSTKSVSWAVFVKKYLNRKDQYKYEWVDGYVEKTKRAMNQYQLRIAANLTKLFYQLEFADKVDGVLMAEIDTFFLETSFRRPDLAYFSEEQIQKTEQKINQIPAFVIEVISTNDLINPLQKKMREYRKAGVKVVWHIFPELREVHIYTGEKMTICSGKKICSAAPALPDFKLAANDIFPKSV